MTTIERLTPEFIESFPASMNPGVLYISIEYGTCGHLCACGCGTEVITPLGPAQWAFTYDGKNVSLRPSVGNWGLPCKSHYIVDRGNVRWARTFSDREIAHNRERDRAVLERGEDHSRYGNAWPATLRDVVDDAEHDRALAAGGGDHHGGDGDHRQAGGGGRRADDAAQHPVADRPAGRLWHFVRRLSAGRRTL